MVKLNTGNGGKFLGHGDIANGDKIKFLNEGAYVASSRYKYEDGNPKQDFQMKVEYKGEEFILTVGKTSRNEMIAWYGDDTELWVGKEASMTIKAYPSLRTKGIVLLGTDGTTRLDEFGEIMPEYASQAEEGPVAATQEQVEEWDK